MTTTQVAVSILTLYNNIIVSEINGLEFDIESLERLYIAANGAREVFGRSSEVAVRLALTFRQAIEQALVDQDLSVLGVGGPETLGRKWISPQGLEVAVAETVAEANVAFASASQRRERLEANKREIGRLLRERGLNFSASSR